MNYYLNSNKQSSDSGCNYEIHKETCPYYYNYKSGNNFIYLGYFYSERDALIEAKRQYPKNAHEIDGCAYCCASIHKK